MFTYIWMHSNASRKPGIGYSIIKHYNLNNVYNIYHFDIWKDNGRYYTLVLMGFTISAMFVRIINSGIQFQLHIIKYLTICDWSVFVKKEEKNSLLQCLTLSCLSALILAHVSYFLTYCELLNFILVNLDLVFLSRPHRQIQN